MLDKLLYFLAWLGLWTPPLVLLNSDAPAGNVTATPAQVVELTATLMQALVQRFVTADGRQVSYLALEQSDFYPRNFQALGTILKTADPDDMQEKQRKAFFINVYNLLTIHALLHLRRLPRSTLTVPSFWQRYAYQIGRHTLHLDHMEHGILRGNRRHPTTGSVMFAEDDPRLALTLPADHRVHAALNCGALSCPPLTWYSETQLEQRLGAALHTLCNNGVTFTNQHDLIINSIFDWFSTDFAPTQSLTLRWLAECVEDGATSRALQEAALGKQHFTFLYDWSLNAVSGVAGGRVKVAVYFEALCPDSKNFFRRQLYPAWRDLQDIIDLEFIPFGKARATPTGTGDYHFQCQHGPHECHGNRVMSCAQNSLPITTQYDLFMCMMTKEDPSSSGRQCSEEVGIRWAPIDECSTSKAGASLLHMNGIRTANLKPRVSFIPTITIDGHYNDYQLRSSLSDLKSQVCAAYQGPPHQNCL